MSTIIQCPTCEVVITELDSEECIPSNQTEEPIQISKQDSNILHEVEPFPVQFHDREAHQTASSNLESARTYFDASKLRISFNR